jgi:hypothetical protein
VPAHKNIFISIKTMHYGFWQIFGGVARIADAIIDNKFWRK